MAKWTKAKQPFVDKIKAAKTAEEFFIGIGTTRVTQERMLKRRYQGMAKMVHPDHNPGVEEANLVLAALNVLHEEAERKIADGTFGKSLATITFKDKSRSRSIEEIEPLTRGDIADLYTGRLDGKKVVLKIASDARDSDLIKNEAAVLKDLSGTPDADHFMKYLPTLVDSIKLDGKQANIFEFVEGSHTLEKVLSLYPDGLEGKHVAWIWRRLLEVSIWAHLNGHLHMAIIPSNILILPANHGIKLLDWCYSGHVGSSAKAIVPEYEEFFPPEARLKKTAYASFDLYMIAKCIRNLIEGVEGAKKVGWSLRAPSYYTGMIAACLITNPNMRYTDAQEVYDDLRKNVEKMYGPPKFIPFELPA
jgi:serine/threonine protein kinase